MPGQYRRSVGEEAKRKGCPECFRENRKALAQRSAANRHGTLADAVKGLPVTLADAGVNLADFSAKTRHTFSWRCPRGYTFRREARLVIKNSDCPWCKSPPLAELRPDLAEEWAEPSLHWKAKGDLGTFLYRLYDSDGTIVAPDGTTAIINGAKHGSRIFKRYQGEFRGLIKRLKNSAGKTRTEGV